MSDEDHPGKRHNTTPLQSHYGLSCRLYVIFFRHGLAKGCTHTHPCHANWAGMLKPIRGTVMIDPGSGHEPEQDHQVMLDVSQSGNGTRFSIGSPTERGVGGGRLSRGVHSGGDGRNGTLMGRHEGAEQTSPLRRGGLSDRDSIRPAVVGAGRYLGGTFERGLETRMWMGGTRHTWSRKWRLLRKT